MKTTAVFLDRDGVINVAVRGIWTNHEDDFKLYPHTIEAMQLLCKMDIPIFIVTNQSGVARGTLLHSQYYAITTEMLRLFEENNIYITRVYECLHAKDGSVRCPCRKPGIGMIENAMREYQIEPGKIWLVGDLAIDIEMAHSAGLTPIMVQTGLCNDEELAKAVSITRELGKSFFIDDDLYKACCRIVNASSPTQDNTS